MFWTLTFVFRVTLRLLFLCCLLKVDASQTNGTVDDQARLYNHLFSNSDYVKQIRPADVGKQIHISLRIGLLKIDLDEQKEILTTTVYIFQTWQDNRLVWDEKDYGNVESMRVPAENIWLPDVSLWNSAPDVKNVHNERDVFLTSSGYVHFVPEITMSSHCPMDLTDFPYDTQTCVMVLGSWVYTQKDVDVFFLETDDELGFKFVREFEIDLTTESDSVPIFDHPAWDLVNKKAKGIIKSVKFACCRDPFALVEVTLQLRRKDSYYKFLSTGPSVLFAMLIPVTFLIPTNSPQKVTFGMFLIISITLMILTLENSIPFHHASVPKRAMFYFVSLTLASISVFLSTIIIAIAEWGRRGSPLPAFANRLFLGRCGIRRFVCMSVTMYDPIETYNTPLLQYQRDAPVSELEEVDTDMNTVFKRPKTSEAIAGPNNSQMMYRRMIQEWWDLARVLDRLCFILFTILFFLSTAACL